MLIALIALSLVSLPDDPEGVITTAPGGVQSVAVGAVAPVADAGPAVSLQSLPAHGLSTAEQIKHWVGQRVPGGRPFDDETYDPLAFSDDRKVHGEVSAAIGTGDFSAFGARISIPVGDSGRIDLSYSESRNDPWAYGFGFGGSGRFDPRFGPGYRGHYDPFFIGEGVVVPGSRLDAWRERDSDSPRTRVTPAREPFPGT